MINTELLERVIAESGLKKGYIAEQLGVSRTTLNNYITNKAEFRVSQVNTLSTLLKIDEAQRTAIFFAVDGG